MRKILSALLAVMMLVGVFAALPVFADDAIEPVKTIDGTTTGDYNGVDLVVTEVMVNSKSNVDKFNDIQDTLSTSKTSSYDNFDYIEIYNKGTEAVNLYDYCLLRRANHGVVHAYEDEGTFDRQNYIAPNSIYQSSYGVNSSLKKWDVTNPNETTYDASKPTSEQLHWLEPGQFAAIWFWTSQCDTVSQNNGKSMAAPDLSHDAGENAYYFPEFRKHYNVPDDTIVLAVYAQNNATNAPKAFDLVAGSAYMYALAARDFDIAEPAIENVKSNTPELNDKIESLFCWGTGTKAGIPTTDGTDHQATNYMPPVSAPDMYNQEYINLYKDTTGFDAAAVLAKNFDYVQTGHSLSYKEMAIYRYAEEPTVGSMPLYQWAYVHPEGLWANWNDLYERADAELDAVVRAKVYDIVAAEITKTVSEDGNITQTNKPTVIEERLAAANATGGEIDTRTAARLADPNQVAADLREHYENLLKNIICDYDEAINYKVYETDTEGNVVVDEDGNPKNTDVALLLDENGDLLHVVENAQYVWASRVTERFVELNAYKLVDAEVKDEEQNDPNLVDREELEDKHNQEKTGIQNRGDVTVNGKTYTKYAQTGSKTEYYYDAATGKFYTMKVTEIPAVTETVNKLNGLGIALIIVGAVIAVAGIAVAVIIVLKKKNKPVAADDVAAEGEVQVIDETAEAPAEEAPVEKNDQE